MPKDNETREQAFTRLANARVKKALKSVRLIGNLGAYPHTAVQTAKIMEALRGSVESVEYELGGEKEKTPEFEL